MDPNEGERKKAYHELINFATQGMSENAQFSIAIAVGIFGILAIFATIDNYDKGAQDSFWKTAKDSSDPLELLLIGGVSLREPIARYGPFVMNTQQEINQAIEEYRSGRLG